MKTTIQSLIYTTTIASISAVSAETYVNQIWQTNSYTDATGKEVVTDYLLDNLKNEGSQDASAGIMGTSVFELFTIGSETGETTLLDTETVSSYYSDASITIQGPQEDVYNQNANNIPRTQVGRGFTLTYVVSGLKAPGAGVPEAASSVLLRRSSFSYEPGATSLTAGQEADTVVDVDLEKDGKTSSEEYTQIQDEDLTKVRGEEVYTVFMKPDEDVTSYSELDSAKVIVWPLSAGSFSGIEDGKTYRAVPPVTVDLVDLYPTSNTYLRITGGPDSVELNYGGYINTHDTPSSVSFPLNSINDLLTKDGKYTVELIHDSPFEQVSFGSKSFILDRSVKVRGAITTGE